MIFQEEKLLIYDFLRRKIIMQIDFSVLPIILITNMFTLLM